MKKHSTLVAIGSLIGALTWGAKAPALLGMVRGGELKVATLLLIVAAVIALLVGGVRVFLGRSARVAFTLHIALTAAVIALIPFFLVAFEAVTVSLLVAVAALALSFFPPPPAADYLPERLPVRLGELRHTARFYFSPFGRTGRKMFWLLAVLPFSVLGFAFGSYARVTGEPLLPFNALLFVGPFLAWIQAAIIARRCHDVGLSGWVAAAVVAAPFVLVFAGLGAYVIQLQIAIYVAVLGLGFVPGQKGENRFGPDPTR